MTAFVARTAKLRAVVIKRSMPPSKCSYPGTWGSDTVFIDLDLGLVMRVSIP
jgi:hypothetical protein